MEQHELNIKGNYIEKDFLKQFLKFYYLVENRYPKVRLNGNGSAGSIIFYQLKFKRTMN